MGIKHEKLIEVLKCSDKIKVENTNLSHERFKRVFNCSVNDIEFKIVWHQNYSTLYFGEVIVLFYDLKCNGFYPNSARLNLNFKHEDNDTVCVIPVEMKEKP